MQGFQIGISPHPQKILIAQIHRPLQRLDRIIRMSRQRITASQIVPCGVIVRERTDNLAIYRQPFVELSKPCVKIAKGFQYQDVIRTSCPQFLQKPQFDFL